MAMTGPLKIAAGGALALGSAIYGAAASSKLNNKYKELIQRQRDANQRWYDVRMAQDYTQRSDVQAALKRQRELLDEQYRRANAAGIVAGGTDESIALQKEAANRSLAQTMTDVAGRASEYKDNVERQYRQQDAALNQQQAQDYRQQAAATAQAASQAVNAGLNLVGQGAAENEKAKQDMLSMFTGGAANGGGANGLPVDMSKTGGVWDGVTKLTV